MKRISNVSFAVLTLVILFISSCVKDESTNPDGTPAVTDVRDKFVGDWICTETTGPDEDKFTITISKDANDAYIKIVNFNNLGKPYSARVGVSNSNMSIGIQSISGTTYEGSGQYASNKITMTYTINDGITKQTATASCVK